MLSVLTDSELAKITTDSGDDENLSLIADAIESAEAFVESYVAKQYSVPVLGSDGTPPAEIKQAVRVVARYDLLQRRRPADYVLKSYAMAMKWLESVGRGEAVIVLEDASGNVESQGSTFASSGQASRGTPPDDVTVTFSGPFV